MGQLRIEDTPDGWRSPWMPEGSKEAWKTLESHICDVCLGLQDDTSSDEEYVLDRAVYEATKSYEDKFYMLLRTMCGAEFYVEYR